MGKRAYVIAVSMLVGCGAAPSVQQSETTLTEEEAIRASRVQCAPAKTIAYPGDRILMRATKPVTWTTSAGAITDAASFTAPSRPGLVTVTATASGSVAACIVQVVARPTANPGTGEGVALSVHTALGIPGPANESSTHYLIDKGDYVVSFNADRKAPNWVSWEMNGTYVGGASRKDNWNPDQDIDLPQAREVDYKKSGYDRGHMCPSADRSRDDAVNARTFVFTNAMPQLAAVNRGPWGNFEAYLQTLAVDGKQLFIISGGIYDDAPESIGEGVAVPNATWKVAVVLNRLGDRAPDVSQSTRAIAIIVPNDDSVAQSDDWEIYQVRVRDVESATGYNFLSDVSTSIQTAIE